MELPNKENIRRLGKKENYIYLGILDNTKQRWKKREEESTSEEQENFYGPSSAVEISIKGINTWVVSLVRQSGLFLNWTREEFKQINKKEIDDDTPERWHRQTISIKNREEEDSPELRNALIQQYMDSWNTLKYSKEGLITATSNNNIDNIRANRKIIKIRIQKRE